MIWAKLSPIGVPVILSNLGPEDETWVQVPDHLGMAEARLVFLSAGGWLPRPVIAAPVAATSGEMLTLTWADLPAGSEWAVHDVECSSRIAADTVEGLLVLSIEDAGTYLIQIDPPAPWLPYSLEVAK